MAEFIDAAPPGWKRNFFLAEIYRDRITKCESFELVADGSIRHWGQVFSLDTPVCVEIEASRRDEYVVVDICVSVHISTLCSRCLEPAGVAINGKLRYLFSLRSYLESLEEGSYVSAGEEEIRSVVSWDEVINLGELAWETLITALPGAVLCSDGCKGLCPQCGASLNIMECDCKKETGDPRFEALKGLLDDNNQDT